MSLSDLTKTIKSAAESLQSHGPVEDEERQALLAAMENLKFGLETPLDATIRIVLGAYDFIAVKLGVELGLFNQLTSAQGVAKEAAELAETFGADTGLVNRILRLLTVTNLAKEVGEQKCTVAPLTPAFSDFSPLSQSVRHLYLASEVSYKLPGFLRQTGYKEPTDAAHGPFQFALDTKLHVFDWMKDHPADQAAFNTHMQVQRIERGPNWFDFYPIQERLLQKPTESSVPFLVDIGGGLGHDISAFAAKFPDLQGRLVLEDLPHVIEAIDKEENKPDAKIERVKYDFFTPQPLKGARVYYMRTVLHDWPDKQALEILKNVWDAMDEDSVLLINENSLPDVGAPAFLVKADWVIMSLLAALDRTSKQFKELLDKAGFEIEGPWKSDAVGGVGMLFEAKKRVTASSLLQDKLCHDLNSKLNSI